MCKSNSMDSLWCVDVVPGQLDMRLSQQKMQDLIVVVMIGALL
jgi:hypothetical protein